VFLLFITVLIYEKIPRGKNVGSKDSKGFHPAIGEGALTRNPAIWRFPVGKATKKSEGLVRIFKWVLSFGFS